MADRLTQLTMRYMKAVQALVFIGGLIVLALAALFVFRNGIATGLWPWDDGRLSFIFVGSILAAVCVAMLWIGWTGELGALPGGAINVFIIGASAAIYFFMLAFADGRTGLVPYGAVSAVIAIASAAGFWWSRRIPLRESSPTPLLVRVSFGIFAVALLLAGGALIFRLQIFPWTLNPDSSVIFGGIFLGDASYFLYGLIRPRWHNALGQLLSFLAYDLVLIAPFLALTATVASDHLISLIVYLAVLIYSGSLAIYYLFVNPQTRFGSGTRLRSRPQGSLQEGAPS